MFEEITKPTKGYMKCHAYNNKKQCWEDWGYFLISPLTANEKIEECKEKDIQIIFIDFNGKQYRSFDLKNIRK